MSANNELPILILGGGIGGLCLSIALAQKGFPCKVLEQSESFSEVGAGIQLGPNATRILHNLGLEEMLSQYITEPDALLICNGITNKALNHIQLKNNIRQLFQAPYYTIYRADLQKCLLDRASQFPNIKIQNGFQANVIESENNSVYVKSKDDKKSHGRFLVGADGIWSFIRKHISHNNQPKFCGKAAWRVLVPINICPNFIDRETVTLYLGPQSHLVCYPVKSGKYLNIVAIARDTEANPSWDNISSHEALLEGFERWHTDIKTFLKKIDGWAKWPLYKCDVVHQWYNNQCVLLGDAAHPTLPFLAQGAAMAIEDAKCLSDLLSQKNDFQDAFLEYQKIRFDRVYKVQKTSMKNGIIYHLEGLPAFVRNQVISRRSGASLLKYFNWLYGYRV